MTYDPNAPWMDPSYQGSWADAFGGYDPGMGADAEQDPTMELLGLGNLSTAPSPAAPVRPPGIMKRLAMQLADKPLPGLAPNQFQSPAQAFLGNAIPSAANAWARGSVKADQAKLAADPNSPDGRMRSLAEGLSKSTDPETQIAALSILSALGPGGPKKSGDIVSHAAGLLRQHGISKEKAATKKARQEMALEPMDGETPEAFAKRKGTMAGTAAAAANAVPGSKVAKAENPDEMAPALSDEELDLPALRYLHDGTMLAAGMGKAGTALRTRVLKRAGYLQRKLNLSPDIATNKTQLAADSKSLADMQTSLDGLTAFESTALKNTEMALKASEKIPDTGVKFLNAFVRGTASNFGSEDVQGFRTALEPVRSEFNKILTSGGKLSGGNTITDSQRHDMQAVLGDDFTRGQLKRALAILKTDSDNRKASYTEQIRLIKARQSWASMLQQPAQPSGDVEWTTDANGNPVPKTP